MNGPTTHFPANYMYTCKNPKKYWFNLCKCPTFLLKQLSFLENYISAFIFFKWPGDDNFLLCMQVLPERAIHDIQTFNTLYSASSPVITSIFSSKHFCDDLEEKAAADSIRDIFLIESGPKRINREKKTHTHT